MFMDISKKHALRNVEMDRYEQQQDAREWNQQQMKIEDQVMEEELEVKIID